jgi:hypothetical protein
MVARLWEILKAEGTQTVAGSPIERAFSFSRRPFVQEKLRETWPSSKGTTLDVVAFNNQVYASDMSDAGKMALACDLVRDPERHHSARHFAAQYISGKAPKDLKVAEAMYAAMKTAVFTNPYLDRGVALDEIPAKMRVMKCNLGMLPECFAHVMGSTQHPKGIEWILEFEHGIPGYIVPFALTRLDPTLKDRRVLERMVHRACLERDPGGSYLGGRERDYLDRVFSRPFFAADSDQAEADAWLKAFDAGTLDRSSANHWMWALPDRGMSRLLPDEDKSDR